MTSAHMNIHQQLTNRTNRKMSSPSSCSSCSSSEGAAPKPNFYTFDAWVNTPEGRKAMSSWDESKWPECAVCGGTSNSEIDICRYWEPCCMCGAFICENHKAKYCSSKCRAEGRTKK